METYFTERVEEFWLKISVSHTEKLAEIRLWDNLKIVVDNDFIWVRGILPEQLYSKEIENIPFKSIYYLKDGFLFKKGELLPEYPIKIGWMWSPITTFFKIEFPKYNHNLFNVEGDIKINLVSSSSEKEISALLLEKNIFKDYVLSAPNVRLKPLEWILIDNFVLVVGKPLLPIPGTSYWSKNSFLIPAGLDFKYANFIDFLEVKLNPKNENLILFTHKESYISFDKNDLKPLSRSSVRKTML